MNPGLGMMISVASLVGAVALARRSCRGWLLLTLIGCAGALGCALAILLGAPAWEWRGPIALGGDPLHLRIDLVSAVFLALVGVAGGAGAVYARGYWSDADYPQSAGRGRAWWSAMVLSMVLVLVASNGLHFLLAWEAFALSAYFLIRLDAEPRAVQQAGWLYLAASHAGTLLLFAFFAALAARTGSWDLIPLRDRPDLAPLFWIALFGFGVKAGLFPLHIWLPPAHANAPSHVSALMSGVALKMGVYGWVRFGGWMAPPIAAGWFLLSLGAVSAVVGIAYAMAQHDLKRLLAYSSVENIGIIAMGIGGAQLAMARGYPAWGGLLLAGALLHVWNHGLFKSLLFFGAGSILHATGTRQLSRLGGLWRAMPWTACCFALGSMAVSALPPLNGLVSEWLLYLGLVQALQSGGSAYWPFIPAAMLLAISGALALAVFVKATGILMLGAPRSSGAAHAHECGLWMRAPMLGLALACGAIGLVPAACWPALARVVRGWSDGAFVVAMPLGPLGRAHIALAAAMAAGGLFMVWRLGAMRRAPTWDCGYAAPTRRMQYTSGSFAGLLVGWLAGAVDVTATRRRPRGFFPRHAVWMEQVPDVVQQVLLSPAARFSMKLSQGALNLQHGRLPSYIVYMLAGLAALAALVAGGELW